MLGHKEIVHLLLEAGAPVKIKNNNGWNSLVEAISYGSRDISKFTLKVSSLTFLFSH
jgi:ankyrin repeat protein